MAPFWLGIVVALIPSALLIGWLAWRGGVFRKETTNAERKSLSLRG